MMAVWKADWEAVLVCMPFLLAASGPQPPSPPWGPSGTWECRSSQREESEALMDLILEFQGQRLEDQRASLSLSCPSHSLLSALSQSDRMEDQRRSLPDLEDVLALVPEGQEDFLSLVQRVQSRRMDEQRASLRTHSAGSSPRRHHHHHHNR
uniref:Uncharacterized protein n=1 Tax=Mola mola TaxID=94237 RepID=A0A3Q3XG57_MOLML